jgi:hypothetical protein
MYDSKAGLSGRFLCRRSRSNHGGNRERGDDADYSDYYQKFDQGESVLLSTMVHSSAMNYGKSFVSN